MKKTVQIFTIILTILLLSVAGIVLVEPARANGIPYFPEPLPVNHGYIRSNGDVDPPTLPIQHQGNIYVVTANIVNCCISIQKDNIELNGNGFSISIPNYGEKDSTGATKSVPPFIDVTNHTNVVISQFKLQNVKTSAISVYNSSKITLSKNTITSCSWIAISQCTDCIVTNNTLNNNYYGIYGYKNNNIDIEINQISGSSSHGILLEDAKLNIIGNIFTGNGQCAICYLQSGSRVVGNIFQNNEQAILSYDSGLEINHNNFINNQRDVAIDAPNILDDGNSGNYWSKHPNSEPYEFRSVFITNTELNIDRYPQPTPYVFGYNSPTINLISPENKNYANSTVTLSYSGSKLISRTTYSLDGKAEIEFSNGTIVTGLANGGHSLKIYAEDIFGKEGTTETTFEVHNTGSSTINDSFYGLNSTSLTATISVIVIIAVVSAGLLVYFKKHKR
jgi:parallel beta-helix repeat protein